MSSMHTFLLSLEVEPMSTGQAYTELPLQCTLVHQFHTALTSQALTAALEPILVEMSPLWLIALSSQSFGPNHKIVSLVEPTLELRSAHQKIYTFLNALGVQYAEKDWVGEGYRPHVTNQANRALAPNSRILSTKIYLIEIEHPLRGNHKSVRSSFELLA